MPALPFKQVDVFSREPFMGNPVAVILDGAALSTQQMQQIANWTNLSETTFVEPVTEAHADYHVRIFTPNAELPFAGHPTLGTAHALLEAGIVKPKDGVLVQQCRKGLIRLDVDGTHISLAIPEPAITPLDQAQCDELEAVLGVRADRAMTPCLIDVGARWVVAQVASAQAVLDVRPDFVRMTEQDRKGRHTGVVIFGPQPDGVEARIEIRAFAASQGQAVGRNGQIRLVLSEQSVHVGGYSVTCVDGVLTTPTTGSATERGIASTE